MFKLDMEQIFNVPAIRLFDAWTKVEMIKTWFAPGNMKVPEASADVQVGGKYRIVMEDESGEQHIVVGEYKELVEGEKIVFSWRWENSPNTTLVTVNLQAIDDNTTKLHLNHSEFIEEFLYKNTKIGR